MNRSQYIYLLACCLLLVPIATQAQSTDWNYQSQIETVKRAGYHDIPLGPETTARLNAVGGNLRVLDHRGDEVPFLHFMEDQVAQDVRLKWYPRFEDSYSRRWYTRSYFQNPRRDAIDRMVLKVRNADVTQHFWLSGSDDNNRWFIIKEDYVYDAAYDPNSTYNLMTIHFPPVDYKYYKVEIRHHWHEPIQIMGAGYYDVKESNGALQKAPDPIVTQRQQGRKSIVDIRFDAPHYVDQLFFEIDGPEMYLREAELQRLVAQGGEHYETIDNFTISSKEVNQLDPERIRSQALRLIVDNKDDKPIRVAAVQAHQVRQHLTMKLSPVGDYRLVVGREGMRSPEYDLAHFVSDLPKWRPKATLSAQEDLGALRILREMEREDSLAATLPSEPEAAATQPGSPEPTTFPEADAVEPQPLLNSKGWIWAGIVLIIVVLGWMALRMLKDMDKEEPEA